MNIEAKTYVRDGRSPLPQSEITSRIMSSIKAKNTQPEIRLRKALWTVGVRGYRLHYKNIPGRPDIAFTAKKLAIFVNGCYWHRCPICSPSTPKSNTDFWEQKFSANMERDIRKNRELDELGWEVITIWECQIKKDIAKQVYQIQIKLV